MKVEIDNYMIAAMVAMLIILFWCSGTSRESLTFNQAVRRASAASGSAGSAANAAPSLDQQKRNALNYIITSFGQSLMPNKFIYFTFGSTHGFYLSNCPFVFNMFDWHFSSLPYTSDTLFNTIANNSQSGGLAFTTCCVNAFKQYFMNLYNQGTFYVDMVNIRSSATIKNTIYSLIDPTCTFIPPAVAMS